jgi:hypothetical protein
MEVNPRLGGLHRLGARLGCDLVQAAYLSLCGQPVPSFDPARAATRTWCKMAKDLTATYHLLLSNPSRAIPRLLSYLSCPTDALFSARDVRPWMDSLARAMGWRWAARPAR